MSRVVVILVNWNGWRDTVECLESLRYLDYRDFSVVVCDNDSMDDSVGRIREWADRSGVSCVEYRRDEAEAASVAMSGPFLTLIRTGGNLGFAGGSNVGLRYALSQIDCKFCWLLNNDTVVEPSALTHLVARMQEQPRIGICGSTVLHYHNHGKIQALGGGFYCRWLGLPWHYGRFVRWDASVDQRRAEARMNYVEGASMLLSRRFFEEIGLMCEDYFLYFEEVDWAIRARGRFSLGYAPQSIVYHKVGSSIGTSSNPAKKSDTSDYFNIRNRLLFTRRFYPAALPTVWLVIVGALLLRICLGRRDRAMMIFRLLCGNLERPAAMQPGHPFTS